MKSLLLATACLTLLPPGAFAQTKPADEVQAYARIVHASYADAYEGGKALDAAIQKLLDKPTQANLDTARAVWTKARQPYLQTEAYRFYEGPIDFVNAKTGEEGPEGRLNAWPLNEAYIDYVQGNPQAGIINDPNTPITRAALTGANQQKDEADVSTGYHAIEFLLWGQDLSKDGPGNRPFSDYLPGKGNNDRRRAYLAEVSHLLVDDLAFLVKSWEPGKENYAKEFAAEKPDAALTRILTGMATLSGFELASERLATALDSGDQEDEHSCFSDTTTQDFFYNEQGVANLYFGTYGGQKSVGIYDLVNEKDAALAKKLAEKITATQALLKAFPAPFDREVLAAAPDSPARKQAEAAVVSLQEQAQLLQQAGKVLGLNVAIVTD